MSATRPVIGDGSGTATNTQSFFMANPWPETVPPLDMMSDRTGRGAPAPDKARDTGEMVATAPIKLVQETGQQSGFLVFRPVYISGADPKTVERRRQSIKGFTVGVYRIGDMLAAALENDAGALNHIRMYDETDRTNSGALLYDSARRTAAIVPPSGDVDADTQGFVLNARLNIAGRAWTVIIRPTASLVTPVERFSPWLFLAAGIVMSVLVYGLLASARIRNSVIALEVENRTRELAQEVIERKAAESAHRNGADWHIYLS
jgi:CHASE1-domain containing sensor protein